MSTKLTILLLLATTIYSNTKTQPTIQEFVKYIEDSNTSDNTMINLLTQGEMKGYYKLTYFWQLYEALHQKYPQFVSKKTKIGSTYKK